MSHIRTKIMKLYCLGFVFTLDGQYVCLIEKARPEWQAGCINGPGGHIEPGETPLEAVQREIKEETGFEIHALGWKHVCIMEGTDYKLNVFSAFIDPVNNPFNTDETEPVLWYSVKHLPLNVIDNLHWIIPMCLDQNIGGTFTIPVLK